MATSVVTTPRPLPPNLFLVDVEATGPTPMTAKMTEVAIVHVASLSAFYLHLWPFTPHPDVPALPVVPEGAAPEVFVETYQGEERLTASGPLASPQEAYTLLQEWVREVYPQGGPSLVSDNPAFDGMFLRCWLDEVGDPSLFGHSGRRIGDFAAGLQGDWRKHNAWKGLRTEAHTHHPLADARGNAGALRRLLGHPGTLS